MQAIFSNHKGMKLEITKGKLEKKKICQYVQINHTSQQAVEQSTFLYVLYI